jgi:hypothetical protein
MPELTSSTYLLAAIRAAGGPVRTSDAERILADSSWSCHRNTARKRLRGLTRGGLLAVDTDADGRHVYTATPWMEASS